MKNMKISHLREFVLLAEELNYSRVARHFYISQSVLSKHILELERVIGVSLFTRSSHSVRLTQIGELFLESAQAVVDAHDKALADVDVARRQMESSLRIGYVPGASRLFLAEACSLFMEGHPEAYLDIISLDPGEIADALRENEIDVGIGLSTRYAPRGIFGFRQIYQDVFDVLVSRRHSLADREFLVAEDLVGKPIVAASSSKMPELSDFLSRQLQGTGLSSQVLEIINDRDSILPLLKMDELGVFLFPRHRRGEFGPSYKQIPLRDIDLRYDVSIIWKKSREQDSFIDFGDCVLAAYAECCASTTACIP